MESIKAPRDNQKGMSPEVPTDELSFEGERDMRRGWPTWVIGLGLLALVLLILTGAFFLNSRLKPKVGTEEVAGGAILATRTTQPAVPASGVSSTPGNSTTSNTDVGQTSPAGTPDTSQVVSQAYLHYWDVYSNALYTLDASHLEDVLAGDELSRSHEAIDGLRSEGHAAKTDVQHHFAIIALTEDTATIQDEFLNKSYLVDAATRHALQTPTGGDPETISFQLKLLDGKWKVVSVVKINETIKSQ